MYNVQGHTTSVLASYSRCCYQTPPLLQSPRSLFITRLRCRNYHAVIDNVD